jgi:hypothetical protein
MVAHLFRIRGQSSSALVLVLLCIVMSSVTRGATFYYAHKSLVYINYINFLYIGVTGSAVCSYRYCSASPPPHPKMPCRDSNREPYGRQGRANQWDTPHPVKHICLPLRFILISTVWQFISVVVFEGYSFKKLTGGFFWLFFSISLYSTLLHLPPLRFHCARGCWTARTVATSALAVRRTNHTARSHPQTARSHPQRLDLIHHG